MPIQDTRLHTQHPQPLKPPRFTVDTAVKHSLPVLCCSSPAVKLRNIALGRLGNGTLSLHDALGVLLFCSNQEFSVLPKSGAASLLSNASTILHSRQLEPTERSALLMSLEEIFLTNRPRFVRKIERKVGERAVPVSGIDAELTAIMYRTESPPAALRIGLLGIARAKAALACAEHFRGKLIECHALEFKVPGLDKSLELILNLIAMSGHREHQAVLNILDERILRMAREVSRER